MAMRDRLYIRASAEDLERWQRAAEKAGARSLSELTRSLLDAHAVKVGRSPAVVSAPGPEADWGAVIARIGAGLPAK
jgi:hypothetical protein